MATILFFCLLIVIILALTPDKAQRKQDGW